MMEAVHRYEGTVNQVMGDGIMALFGAPLALEDHAVRACYAALAMQSAIRVYNEPLRRSQGVEMQIRVGLNSGEVVVRAIDSDLHMDYTAVGQTTHLAARMEQLASPGTTRLTGNTLGLAEGFIKVTSLGPMPVRGLDQPVEVFELAGAGEARSRFQAAASRGLTTFVGRSAELGQMFSALERSQAGHGEVVALMGEPGVGKSRLVWEFTRSHRLHNWLVLESDSVSYGKASAYRPVIDLLKNYFQVEDRDDARRVREKATGKLLTLDETLKPMLVPLLALLDVAVDDESWKPLDPVQKRLRTLDACKRLILRESQVQPLVVVFEDLHWIDSETQALLDALVESLPTARLLLLVNFRPEYQPRWTSKTCYTQLRVDPLTGESAEELLRTLLGTDPSLRPLGRFLIERTEGNPLYLEESVRALAETGDLQGSRGAYRLTASLTSIRVPATVQAILAARIDRLSPDDKHLLQAAAVIGKDVPYSLLQAITELSEDALRQRLAALQAGEFLYEKSLFPDLEYTFKHALTHEVAYGGVLQERRKALHARIVTSIERLCADRLVEQVERLAYHTIHAGLAEKAVRYLREAGVKALERSAYPQAVEFLQQAVKQFETLPETDASLMEALRVRMALGPALMATIGYVETEDCYLRALELCDRLGDRSWRFPALWGLWNVSAGRGANQRALELAEETLSLAERSGDATYLLEANHAMWTTLGMLGRTAAATEHCKRGVALYDRRTRPSWWLYGNHDPGVCCRGNLGIASWLLGRPDEAVRWIQEALGLARELGHPFTTTITLYNAAWLHYQRGEAQAATEMANAVIELAQTHGFSVWPERASVILARLLVQRGQLDEGLVQAEEAARRLAALGASSGADTLGAVLLAGAYGIAGQPEKGLQMTESLAARGSVGSYQPEVHRVRGELRLAQSPPALAEADACFRAALDVARARQEKSLELRAAMSLASLLQRSGERHPARAVLAPVYASFDEGLDTADLRRARALLEELT
jgi:tetratricopeptide (TPR) repeat protein